MPEGRWVLRDANGNTDGNTDGNSNTDGNANADALQAPC
jgi:hypothetical protein